MGVNTQRFIRKPLFVDAVRVSANNFDEVVGWCQGEVETDEVPGTGTTKKYIKVRVHNPKNVRQTKAFINDWILYTERGYKVYTNKAFRAAFDLVTDDGAKPLEPVVDNHTTPQGEPHEYVEATSQTIADTVNEQQPPSEGIVPVEPEMLEDVPAAGTPIALPPTPAIVPPEVAPQPESIVEQAPEDAAAGKRVLSEEEQAQMGPEEVRELVSSGEAILAQDLASR